MRYLEAKCKPSPRRTQRRWWGIANRNENKIHVAHRGAGGISRSETTTTIYPCLRRFHASDVSMLSPFLCFLRCFCFRRFHALAGSIIHICGAMHRKTNRETANLRGHAQETNRETTHLRGYAQDTNGETANLRGQTQETNRETANLRGHTQYSLGICIT